MLSASGHAAMTWWGWCASWWGRGIGTPRRRIVDGRLDRASRTTCSVWCLQRCWRMRRWWSARWTLMCMRCVRRRCRRRLRRVVVAGRLVLAGECRVRVCFVVCVRVSCPVSCVVRASGRFFCLSSARERATCGPPRRERASAGALGPTGARASLFRRAPATGSDRHHAAWRGGVRSRFGCGSRTRPPC